MASAFRSSRLIYAMAPDGSDVRNLTQNPAFDFVPDWTPATND